MGMSNDPNDIYKFVEQVTEKATEEHEEFIFQTIKPFCEEIVQEKISKKDLTEALIMWKNSKEQTDRLSTLKAELKQISNMKCLSYDLLADCKAWYIGEIAAIEDWKAPNPVYEEV